MTPGTSFKYPKMSRPRSVTLLSWPPSMAVAFSELASWMLWASAVTVMVSVPLQRGSAGFVGRDDDGVLRVAFESRGFDGHGIGVRRQIQKAKQAGTIGRGRAGRARVGIGQRDGSARHHRIGRVHDSTLQSAGNSLSQQAGCEKCQSTENLCELSDNHQYPLK